MREQSNYMSRVGPRSLRKVCTRLGGGERGGTYLVDLAEKSRNSEYASREMGKFGNEIRNRRGFI